MAERIRVAAAGDIHCAEPLRERIARAFADVEGNADVSVGGEHRATLGPGDHFGEIALIDDGIRSASIVAATDLLCYAMTPWEFRPFVEEHPQVAWVLLETLARRSREAQQAQDS